MNFSSVKISSFKAGLKPTQHDLEVNKIHPTLHTLPPMYTFPFLSHEIIFHRPVFRKDLLNSCKLKEHFRLKGHKIFAKLSASGPETSTILNNVEKLRSIKMVSNFEFDP